MAYTTNPHITNVRQQAVCSRGGRPPERLGHTGVHRSTVWRWLQLPGARDQRYKLVTRSKPVAWTRQTAQASLGGTYCSVETPTTALSLHYLVRAACGGYER